VHIFIKLCLLCFPTSPLGEIPPLLGLPPLPDGSMLPLIPNLGPSWQSWPAPLILTPMLHLEVKLVDGPADFSHDFQEPKELSFSSTKKKVFRRNRFVSRVVILSPIFLIWPPSVNGCTNKELYCMPALTVVPWFRILDGSFLMSPTQGLGTHFTHPPLALRSPNLLFFFF